MIPSKEEKISFHYEDIQFILPNHLLIVDWIYKTIINETKILRQVNYIFCSDNYLHKKIDEIRSDILKNITS